MKGEEGVGCAMTESDGGQSNKKIPGGPRVVFKVNVRMCFPSGSRGEFSQ